MRKIEVLHDYGGARTHEQRIPPGIYDENDKRLFGLAVYLVNNGHALWLESLPPESSEETVLEVLSEPAASFEEVSEPENSSEGNDAAIPEPAPKRKRGRPKKSETSAEAEE